MARIHGPLGAVLDKAGDLTHFRDDTPPPFLPQGGGFGLGSYLTSTAQSFDPRTPEGLVNILTTLVPGAKGGRAGAMSLGRPTPGQASLLNAIFTSSRASKNRSAPIKALFQTGSDVNALADKIGMPAAQRADVGGGPLTFSWAQNPLLAILRGEKLGPYPTGKVGPAAIVTDPGGTIPHGFKGGMDVPPKPGELGDYYQPLPSQEQIDALIGILMGSRGAKN